MKRLLGGFAFDPKLQLLKGLLDEEEIPYEMRNEGLSVAMGEIPFTECMPEIWIINDEDFPKAQELLKNLSEMLKASSKEHEILEAMAKLAAFEFIPFIPKPDSDVLKSVSSEIARRYEIIPIAWDLATPKTLCVAFSDPTDLDKIHEIPGILGVSVTPLIAPLSEIQNALELYYS
jgi:hypothetical protein